MPEERPALPAPVTSGPRVRAFPQRPHRILHDLTGKLEQPRARLDGVAHQINTEIPSYGWWIFPLIELSYGLLRLWPSRSARTELDRVDQNNILVSRWPNRAREGGACK